jgi:glycosyltransferase involved in cell wall biosynthesis
VSENRHGRLRILYILTTLEAGGAEASLLELLQRFDRSRFRPVVCSLISGGRLRTRFNDLDIPVIELGVQPGLAEIKGARLLPLLLRLRPDIVHSRLILSNLWARMGQFAGARVICEERSLDLTRPALMTRLNRATHRLCTVAVANSQAVATAMLERDRIPPHKLRVIYGGVDTARFKPAATAQGSVDFVSVARLERYKGVFDLVDAIAQLRAERPLATLALVGDGTQRELLESALIAKGLNAAVSLRGWQSEVTTELWRAHVFVNASHEEGWPNAILEAMACGLPVVATDVGGTAELVRDGETGLLVEPRQPAALARALQRYLDEPALVETHGRAARQRVLEHFPIEATVAAYERLYAELAS